MPSSTDSHLSISNSSHSAAIVATVPGAELLTLQTVLSALGFTDRQGDIRQAEKETHEQSAPLVAALRAYAADPEDPELAQTLAPLLQQAIADTETELQHLQTLQAQYEREAAQEPVKQSLSRSYWQQGKDWVESNVRWLIGSTAQDQATYYAELADKRRAQLMALQTFAAQLQAQIQSSQAGLAETTVAESTAEAVGEAQFLDSPFRFPNRQRSLQERESEQVKDKSFTDVQLFHQLPTTDPAEKRPVHPKNSLAELPAEAALTTRQEYPPFSDPILTSGIPIARKLLNSESEGSICDAPLELKLSALVAPVGFTLISEAVGTHWSHFFVSNAGDINGDGLGDLLIGAPYSGRSYVVFGSSGVGSSGVLDLSSLNGTNGFKIDGEGGYSGWSVSSAGKINGDVWDDLLIGAHRHASDTSDTDTGRSYVVFGGPGVGSSGVLALSSLNGTNGFKIDGEESGDWSGYSVSRAGDINKDGWDDLLIGAHHHASDTGRSYVVFGGPDVGGSGVLALSSLNGTNGFKIDGEESGDGSGYSVSSAGDINRDGWDDLLIGAHGHVSGTGRSYVVFGGSGIGSSGVLALSSLNGTNGFKIDGEGGYSGWSVSSAGDINRDGWGDLLIGAPEHANSTGRSYVVFGGPGIGSSGVLALSSLNGTNGFKIDGEESGDGSGYSVNRAGDINKDGWDDLLIGAPNHASRTGRSYVVFGGSGIGDSGVLALSSLSGFSGTNGFKIDGEQLGDWSGHSVSRAGDINGDGFSDLLIGTEPGSPTGRIYVLFGRVFPAIRNKLNISQGSAVTLTPDEFAVSSWPTTTQPPFIVCHVQYGQFELPLLNPPGQAIVSFTDTQLRKGEVMFVSDGGFQAPHYTIRVNGLGMLLQSVAAHFSPLTEARSRLKAASELADVAQCEGIILNGAAARDYSGFSVSSAGDVNGDRIDDLLIGAWNASSDGKAQAGASYVVFGRSGMEWNGTVELGSLNGADGFVLNGAARGDQSGGSVSSAGDVNGDGINDLLIGAEYASPGGKLKAGASYVVFGHSGIGRNGALELASLNGTNGFVLNGAAAGDRTGKSVSSVRDVNGDNITDLLIGAPYASPDGKPQAAGAIYVVFGRSGIGWNGTLELASLDGRNGFVLNGFAERHESGGSLSSAGDVNGDGMADLLIGNSGTDASYVVFGRSGIGQNGTLELRGLNGRDGFVLNGANYVSGVGDVNGDGMADLLMGSWGAAPGGKSEAGAGYVVFGRSGIGQNGTLELRGLNGRDGFVLNGAEAADNAGESVGSAGDVNGDGIADLLIGASRAFPERRTFSGSTILAGRSYVVFGRSGIGRNGTLELADLNGSDGFVLSGAAVRDESALSMSSAGDVNGDGIADLLIGADSVSPAGKAGAGASYVVFGKRNTTNPLQLLKNCLPLISGQTLRLSEEYLNVTVSCGDPGAVKYQVSAVRHGRFEWVASPGVPITGFNQSQVTQQQIQFVHDGSPGLPEFTLQMSTFLYEMTAPGFVHFNARPDLVNNSLLVIKGALNPVLPSSLGATDREMPVERLNYTVSEVRSGQFEFQGSSQAILAFSGQNISDGVVFFRHDDSFLPPAFTVTVSDGVNRYTTAGGVNFDLLPELNNNELLINQGEVTVLTSAHLSARSPSHPASNLSFVIQNVTHGQFQRRDTHGALVASNLTEFTQQDVMDQRIQFLHDGSSSKPSYQVAVSDGLATIPAQSALISFNHAPVLTLNPFILDQGQPTLIKSTSLRATDKETSNVNLVFSVTNISGGQFAYVNTPHEQITEFPQSLVSSGSIQFNNTHPKITPGFSVSVRDDGVGGGTPITVGSQPAVIDFNHRPVVKEGEFLINQTVTAGERFSFRINTSIFYDPDVNDTLSFTIERTEGTLPDTLRFDPHRAEFSGMLQDLSELDINVIASDPRSLKALSHFVIHVLPQQSSSLLGLVLTPTAALSILTALAGYMYRRWRMWDHRQLNKFADHLRLALNIDIYDFSNEEGTDYLRKVDYLIVKLNENHDKFYKKLTPEQAKAFAGDVATAMRRHPGMINPAPWYIKGLNWVTCYGRRWVNILNITAFGYETDAIARDAVESYQRRESLEQIDSGAVELVSLQSCSEMDQKDFETKENKPIHPPYVSLHTKKSLGEGVEELETDLKRPGVEQQECKLSLSQQCLLFHSRGESPVVEEETTMEKRMELVEKHVGLVEKQTRQLERRIEPLEKQATIIGTPVNFFPERRQETDKTPKPPSPQLPLFLYGVSEYR